MEDRHSVSGNITGDVSKCFVGVCGGHGGSGASTFCSAKYAFFRELGQERDPEEALRRAILRADEEYLRREVDGTTLVAALSLDEVFVAWEIRGQSLFKGTALPSPCHMTISLAARMRNLALKRLGTNLCFGVWRVEGILAVSRAIGDRMLKRLQQVCGFEQRTIDAERDAYIVLATDGVWDVISNRVGRLICGQPDARLQ